MSDTLYRMDGGAASERDRVPVQGFTGTPEAIERQWYEQVYRGRGDSMRQLTWRAVIMGSVSAACCRCAEYPSSRSPASEDRARTQQVGSSRFHSGPIECSELQLCG